MSNEMARMEPTADDLPERWSRRRLLDICRPRQWPTISREQFTESGYPVYGANGQIGFYSEFTHDSETIAITCRGATCGTINLVPARSYITGNAMALDDLDVSLVEQSFLHQALQHWGVANSISGSAQPQITRQSLSHVALPIPPLDEQRRIAEVLRSVDEAISSAESVLVGAKLTFGALLFDRFCSDQSEASSQNLTALSDLVTLQSGFAFKSQQYQDEGHFLIRIGNVQDGHISLENPKFVKLDEKTQPFELQEGDILTSLTGNIGRVARLCEDHLPAALNQRVARIKPKPEAPMDADYLFFALQSPLFKSSLAGDSGGAAQQNVSPKAIARVKIPLPSLAEQRRVSAVLLSVEDSISQAESSLKQLRETKAALMSDLLSGSVQVPA